MFERKYSLSYLTIEEKLYARKEVKRKRQKDLDKKNIGERWSSYHKLIGNFVCLGEQIFGIKVNIYIYIYMLCLYRVNIYCINKMLEIVLVLR